MFTPRKLKITYTIEATADRGAVFPICLDENGLLENRSVEGPLWTRRDSSPCQKCGSRTPYCLAALAIAPVIESFSDLDSLQEVTAIAEHEGRTTKIRCPAPRALASVMGLLIAASGCSRAMPFRAMALYHLPFASAEETLIRAAGFCLLSRWAEQSLDTEDPFQNLIAAWSDLEEINEHLGRRLLLACPTDAASNGVAFLDALAKIGILGLEAKLDALKPVLLAVRGTAERRLPN